MEPTKKKTKAAETEWYKFQEEICEHFINLGAKAETNVTVQGPTASYNIDVLVTSKHLGTEFTWIIEAKHWNSRVPIEKVNALTTVVKNTGADRGFIISKKGFQRGAKNASKFNNITLLTFDELKTQTKNIIHTESIKMHFNRLILLSSRYWGHSKDIRIKYGLRHDNATGKMEFSGGYLLFLIADLLKQDKIEYPLFIPQAMNDKVGNEHINSFAELNNWFHANLNHLDRKILNAEMEMIKNGEFSPDYQYVTYEVMMILITGNDQQLIKDCFLPPEEIERVEFMREIYLTEKFR